MLAAILHEPGRFEVADIADPAPEDGEVLVRTSVASICGSDLHYMYDPAQPFPARPGSPGHESVGTVLDSRSAHFRPGDQVLLAPDNEYASAFSQMQVCPERFLVKLPGQADPQHLVLAQQLGTVIWAMKRFVPSSVDGGTATVIGAGSAGLFFVQLLRQRGFDRIVVSDLSERRLAMAESFGAHVTVRADHASVSETMLEVTHGEGADLVVEAVGSAQARSQAIGCLKLRGRLCLFGLPEGPESTLAPLESLFRRQATVEMSRRAQYEPGLKSFRQASTMLENGTIDVSGMISHIFLLADLDKAIDLASSRDNGAVKVCLHC